MKTGMLCRKRFSFSQLICFSRIEQHASLRHWHTTLFLQEAFRGAELKMYLIIVCRKAEVIRKFSADVHYCRERHLAFLGFSFNPFFHLCLSSLNIPSNCALFCSRWLNYNKPLCCFHWSICQKVLPNISFSFIYDLHSVTTFRGIVVVYTAHRKYIPASAGFETEILHASILSAVHTWMRSPYMFVVSCFSTVLANLQLDIDCDRETERIFSLLSSNDTKLQNMEGQLDCWSITLWKIVTSDVDLCMVSYVLTHLWRDCFSSAPAWYGLVIKAMTVRLKFRLSVWRDEVTQNWKKFSHYVHSCQWKIGWSFVV